MSKILFIQTSFLGDVILSTALIEKWNQFYPNDQIDVLIRKGNEGVFNDNPKINELIVWDKTTNKYSNLFQVLNRIRKNQYDKVFNLQRFASTGLITAFSAASEKIGFDKNPLSFFYTKKFAHHISATKFLHETQRNQKLIEDYTDAVPSKPKIYISELNELTVDKLVNQPYIVIAPASVWFTKQYPKEKWISFLSRLNQDLNVVFIGSNADRVLCGQIIAEVGLKNQSLRLINLSGELSIQESAALMKKAMMNFVNDSAPLHIASSVNAPVKNNSPVVLVDCMDINLVLKNIIIVRSVLKMINCLMYFL
jgi:heptosyltransferase-2